MEIKLAKRKAPERKRSRNHYASCHEWYINSAFISGLWIKCYVKCTAVTLRFYASRQETFSIVTVSQIKYRITRPVSLYHYFIWNSGCRKFLFRHVSALYCDLLYIYFNSLLLIYFNCRFPESPFSLLIFRFVLKLSPLLLSLLELPLFLCSFFFK